MHEYKLVALKRRWVPEWLFSIVVHWYRFLNSDLAEHPHMRNLLLTERFHYHDLGRAVYGTTCRYCLR
jgi:hypothetical protein